MLGLVCMCWYTVFVFICQKDATFWCDAAMCIHIQRDVLDEPDVCVNQCKSYDLMDFFISHFHFISFDFFAVKNATSQNA